MSGWFRYGNPGEDTLVHVNTGARGGARQCEAPRFENDNPKIGSRCKRMSVALCDAPKCDAPICELHRTKHDSKPNADYCPDHKEMATQ